MLESRYFPLILFLIALAVRLCYILFFPGLPYEVDAAEYVILGENLANSDGYCYLRGHPTAYRLPLYPLFLASLFSLFGSESFTAVAAAEAVLGAAATVVVFYAALFLLGRARPAAIAGLLMAVYPPLVRLTNRFMTENLFSLLVILVAYTLLMALVGPPSRLYALCAGALLGASWLCRPTLFPLLALLPVWALLAFKRQPQRRRFGLEQVAIILGVAFVVLLPWVVRNAIVMKAFIPLDTHGGATLWYQHNSLSKDGYFWSAIPKEKLSLIKSRIEEQKRRIGSGESVRKVMLPVVRKGPMAGFEFLPKEGIQRFVGLTEVERDKEFYRAALRTIANHPLRYCRKTLKETIKFWHVLDDNGSFVASYALVIPFAFIGLLICAKKHGLAQTSLFALPVICSWGLSATINASYRFRVPVEPILLAFAGLPIERTLKTSSKLRRRLILAFIAAYALLCIWCWQNPNLVRSLARSVSGWIGLPAYPTYP